MGLWYTEKQTDNLAISMQVRQNLHRERSPYQDIAVMETEEYGKLLVIDDAVMLTTADEFVYHELIAHGPCSPMAASSGQLSSVAATAGQSGNWCATILSRKHICWNLTSGGAGQSAVLPELASGLSDPRVRFEFGDGIKLIWNSILL